MEKSYPYGRIKDFLTEYYGDDDLDSLFFDIRGEGTDVLGTNLPRERLAQEIVSYLKRREDLPRLLDAMKCTREESYAKEFPQFPDPLGSLGSSLRPAESEMQQGEVEGVNLPRVQKEGGYLINEPPADWVVEERTQRELVESTFGTHLVIGLWTTVISLDR